MSHFVRSLRFSLHQLVLWRDLPHHLHHWLESEEPCATPPWGGMPRQLADPIPDTGYEPKFCIDVSDEHTPINFPTRNRNFPYEYDATIVTTEDLDLPRHSGASSSSKHIAAASRVPTVLTLGSLRNFWKIIILWTVVRSISGNGISSLKNYNLGTKVYFYASSNEDTRCKSSAGRRMGKTSKDTDMAVDESLQKKRWSLKQGKKAKHYILRRWWISVISRMRSWNNIS